jgi:hypothetical protein
MAQHACRYRFVAPYLFDQCALKFGDSAVGGQGKLTSINHDIAASHNVIRCHCNTARCRSG